MAARKKKAITNEERATLTNLLSSALTRAQLARNMGGTQFDGQRDLYAVLGYNSDPDFGDYLAAYERDDIAARIIDAKPESTWRRRAILSEDSEPDSFTEFEMAWNKLVKKRRVFHYLERVDRLAGIGEYGALLLGTDDVRTEEDFERPMAKLRKGVDSIIYLAPLTEASASIASFDVNPASPHFGLPEVYEVDIAALTDSGQVGISNKKIPVHWTRMIHVAEGLTENDYQGTPRLRPVLNRLYDVAKIAGGSAETFWQAAKRVMVLQAKEGYSAVDGDDELTAMMDELIHGLRRVIDLQGYDAKMLETEQVRPDESFRVALALISSATGIPQRILLGSEQGKMASTQDEVNWNGRIADRQLNYAEEVILRPFVDRLIEKGALPRPANDYIVTWPSLFEISDKEKAQVGLLKARTVSTITGKDGLSAAANLAIISEEELRGDLLNLRARKVEHAKSKEPGQADPTATKPTPTAAKPAKATPSSD